MHINKLAPNGVWLGSRDHVILNFVTYAIFRFGWNLV